jgi:hypothetical protein
MIKRAKSVSTMIGVLAGLISGSAAFGATLTEEATAHLQLANAYVHAGRHNDAIEEYKSAYNLNPTGKIGEYSLRALTAYKVTPNVATRAQANDQIHRQSEEFKANLELRLKDDIKVSERSANNRIHAIEEEKNAAVENVIANPSIRTTVVSPLYGGYHATPFGYRYYGAPATVISSVDPVLTQARINLVNHRADLAKEKIASDNAEREEELKARSLTHEKLIDESARNLESQMTDNGSVHLNPNGTNLYVRSYR